MRRTTIIRRFSVSALGSFFSTPVVQVRLANGTSVFFDMIRRAEFLSMVRSGAWPAPSAGGSTPPAV